MISAWYDTDGRTRDQLFATALAMVDVSGIIANRCLAQRTVVILDTCHSGAGLAAQALTNTEIDRLREGAGRYVRSVGVCPIRPASRLPNRRIESPVPPDAAG